MMRRNETGSGLGGNGRGPRDSLLTGLDSIRPCVQENQAKDVLQSHEVAYKPPSLVNQQCRASKM